MRLRFAGLSASVEVPDCPIFLDALAAAAPGWPFTPGAAGGEPVARVERRGDRYLILDPERGTFEASAVGAACSVMADVAAAMMDESPQRLCLHGGGAVFAGRLVVFPGRTRAGKSTLMARLAAGGHVVFGDDVLPVTEDDAHGVAPGMALRPRVPLPAAAGEAFRDFVAAHEAVSDGRYLYLALPEGRLAARDATAPLGAIVLLDRRAGAPATLGPARPAEVLRTLVTQNFSVQAPAGALLDRLHEMMRRLPRFTLTYSDLDEAAALLEDAFSRWPPKVDAAAQAGPADPQPQSDTEAEVPAAGSDLPASVPLRQAEGVTLRAVDGELFLADPHGVAIHHLNRMGAGVWSLLAEPVSREEAAALLCVAFPDVGRERIEADVERLFAALLDAGLVAPAPAGEPGKVSPPRR